jgi:hypothetical protein
MWISLLGWAFSAATIFCYAREDRHHLYTLGFAGACLLGLIYGALIGSWPVAVSEAVWIGFCLWRWYGRIVKGMVGF